MKLTAKTLQQADIWNEHMIHPVAGHYVWDFSVLEPREVKHYVDRLRNTKLKSYVHDEFVNVVSESDGILYINLVQTLEHPYKGGGGGSSQ